MIYLYGIVDQPGASLPGLPGMEEALLLEVIYQDIAGVCRSFTSDIASTVLAANEANLWGHEAVLEALMANHTVLPVCFGTAFASQSDLLSLLAGKYANFSANLGRLHGSVELSLRIGWVAEQDLPAWASRPSQLQPVPAPSGKNYMLGLLQARRQEQALYAHIETQAGKFLPRLDRLAQENSHKVTLAPKPTLSAAYLLDAQKVLAFRQAVDHLAADHPDFCFTLTGPWPPYSFINNTQS